MGHRDRGGHRCEAGWHVGRTGWRPCGVRCAGERPAGAGDAGRRLLLRHACAGGRQCAVDQPGRQRDTQHLAGKHGAHGAPGAGPRLHHRVRQPGVGLQQQGKRHLRLPPGRPHQLVQLPGHRGGQLCRHRGQRRSVHRRGHLHGLCTVLQREHAAQALRLEAFRFSAHLAALPGRGKKCGPQPVRAERDALLPLAGRRDGLGWQHPHKSFRCAGRRPPCQCAAGGGRCAGRPLLSARFPRGSGR